MRIEKVAIMNEVVDRVKASDYCFIINYGGVDVTQLGKLRAALREHESVQPCPFQFHSGSKVGQRGFYNYKPQVVGYNILSTCLSLLIKQNAFDKR